MKLLLKLYLYLFTNVLSFNGDNLVLQFPSIQFFLEFLASQNFVIEVLLCSTKLLGIKITNIPTIMRDKTIKTKILELIYITL